MPKLDLSQIPVRTGSVYPEAFANAVAGRSSQRLGDAGGLTQFGVNLVTLAPGARSSLRHWHETEDEFVMITRGVCTLEDNDGHTPLQPGDCVTFPAGDPNGHSILNLTQEEAAFLVVGSRSGTETAHYPDDNMKVSVADGSFAFTRPDGTPL